jgi:putative transposon-encoded protein
MSKEKPSKKYKTIVKKNGNSAKIKGFKAHIGKEVEVRVLS